MSLDKLNITTETDEIGITVDNEVPDIELTIDQPSDVVMVMPPDELNVIIESKDVGIKVNSNVSDIDLIIEQNPDVIVLPTSGLTGPPGPEGTPGTPGPVGPQGPSGTQTTYTFTQIAVSYVWTIIHNLYRYPSVTVIDSGGTEIIPDVVYDSDIQMRLYFQNPTSGKAYLN